MKSDISAIVSSSGMRFSVGSDSASGRSSIPDKNTVQVPDVQKSVSPLGEKMIREKIEEINRKLIDDHKRIEYSFHERPDVCVMTIIDTDSGDVVKQIPAKSLLDMASAIWDRFGILVNEEG